MSQLTLALGIEHAELFPYWRESLKSWVADALYYRHARNSTGWSMVLQGFLFARLLARNGQLSRVDFRRYWRFNRRIQRIEAAT